MSEEKENDHRTAAELMDFYEDLFKEESPVKTKPLPLGKDGEERDDFSRSEKEINKRY